MTQPLRLALIGCGDFGKLLAPYFERQGASIVALCDPRAEAMAATASALGLDVACFQDHHRLFDAADLDAVVITAANFVHADLTVAAAERGLHVFCEKAMARTVPECWQMVRACERHGVKLMVGHKRRLRPPWARLIELTRDDAPLGEPLSITVSQYADLRPYAFWDSWWGDAALSGGFFWFHGVHVIDWFNAMCGNARRVWGFHGPPHDTRYQYPDLVNAVFAFETGATATITSSSQFPLHKFREAQGPIGQCRHGGFKMVPHMGHIDLYWQRLDEDAPHHERFDDLGFGDAYTREAHDFVRWITEDRPPCLTWREGLRCVELMEAATRSAEADGEPIDLPLYPDLEPDHGSASLKGSHAVR